MSSVDGGEADADDVFPPETPAEYRDDIPDVDACRYDSDGNVAFVRCSECKHWRVNGSGHVCYGPDGKKHERPKTPNAEFRAAMREADDGPINDTMVMLTFGSVCAYHESTRDDEDNLIPACRTGEAAHTPPEKWRSKPRHAAMKIGPIYPCRDCHGDVHRKAAAKLGWEPER